MEPNEITFGTEAAKFVSTYMLREDALRYALVAASPDYQYEDEDVLVVYGHCPEGNRYRFTCRKNRPSHILTVRPVSGDA